MIKDFPVTECILTEADGGTVVFTDWREGEVAEEVKMSPIIQFNSSSKYSVQSPLNFASRYGRMEHCTVDQYL